MTTDQLQQKHLQAINIKILDKMINEARIRKNKYAFHDTDGDLATGRLLALEEVKELLVPCTSITIEHTIGVLEEMKYHDEDMDDMIFPKEVYLVINERIDFRISELKKQKEQL
jgi:hypothetical protein